MPRAKPRDGEIPFAYVGQNIRELRRARGWSQDDLGRRLKKSLTRQTIGGIEAGHNTDLETLADIADTLEIRFAELLQPRDAAAAFFRRLADIVEKGG